MKKNITQSLSASYIAASLISIIVFFLLLTVCSFSYNKSRMESRITKRLEDLTLNANSSLSVPLWQYNNTFLENYIGNLPVSEDIIYASVFGIDGLIAESAHPNFKKYTFSHFTHSKNFITAEIPILYLDQEIGKLRLALDRGHYLHESRVNTFFILLSNFIGLLCITVTTHLFVRCRVLNKVKAIKDTLSALPGQLIDDKDLDCYNDEIRSLTHSINKSLTTSRHLAEQSFNADDLHAINKKLKMEIVERHQAEKLLRQSDERFRYVLNNSPDTLYNINLLSGTYEYISPSCLKTTGYQQKELFLKGMRGIVKLFHPDDRKRLRKHFLDHLSQKGSVPLSSSIEYRFKHKDLGYRYFNDTRTVIFDSKQKPVSVVGSVHDITAQKHNDQEREKLQGKLRQSQKMEAIGTLAGGIAHDFNNILGAILGYADMAKEDVVPGSSIDRDLNEIIKAGDRAKDLVRQILAYSRKDAQKQISVSISSIVKETIKLLRATIPANVTISLTIDPECGNILADPTQIHQVLMNLCANAAHAVESNTDGHIKISLAREPGYGLSAKDVPLPPVENYIVLQVRDNGTGIDSKIVDRVFDPYFTTKAVGKGSGMGLTVVSGIIKGHGGTITVDSTAGAGTVFSVYLPEVKADKTSDRAIQKKIISGKGRILLVDDETSIVKITARRLERLGYDVTAFSRSREALTHFQLYPYDYDLIITDQTMPELTGDKLSIAALKQRPAMPIIICSGYSEKIDEKIAEEIGVQAFLMKPVDKFTLAETVNSVLENNESPEPANSRV